MNRCRWIGGLSVCVSCSPSSRAPVPQSSTITVPSAARTSVHEVLPPKRAVLAPGGESGLRGVQFAADRLNAAGGILGRKLELVIEEESSPKDTVERFRKLALQDKVDAVSGAISTGVGLALGPAAEEMKTIWLAWGATTQKGVEESMPRPKYSFRSTDNECEAVMASLLTARHWKGKFKTVAGINPA